MTNQRQIAAWQEQLRLRDGSRLAWQQFLEAYAGLIHLAVRHVIWDEEHAGDCFVHVCEKLSERSFRRLLTFDPEKGSNFDSWLKVVVRNLALDWHRARVGRPRPLQAILRLSVLAQSVFRLRYQQGLAEDEALVALRREFPEASVGSMQRAETEIETVLSPQQRWVLASQQRVEVSLADEHTSLEVLDCAPTPEEQLAQNELWSRLRRALDELSPGDQILLRLRFEQELTLAEVARFAGLAGPSAADKKIRALLERLRQRLA